MSLPAGIATTSISGTPNLKKNTSPERIAYRGALFLCHSLPPVGPCAALCRDLHGWVVETPGQYRRRPCRASVGPVLASLRIIGFGAVWARSKSKREKMQGLLLHPCMVHRARQCRSRRAFSGFRVTKQKGVAKFIFREKWRCKLDKRRYSAKYSEVAPPEGSVTRFQYQRTNTSLRYGSIRTRWRRSRSCIGRMIAAVNLSLSKRQFGFILAVSVPRMARPIFPMLSSPT